jgi:radical SAM protein with 4Fe4S-binding SPASM domain
VLEPCLDGFTQEKYADYRVGGDVETVKNGIKMVAERKRSSNSKWPLVDVQVVMFDHIKEELPLIDEFLKQAKVDRITYRQESLGFNAPDTTIKGNPLTSDNACFWLYLGMAIGPDGSVYPCCGRSTTRVAYGNILNESLDEIWNNDYYKFTRSLFSEESRYVTTPDEKMKKIPCFQCNEFKKRVARK